LDAYVLRNKRDRVHLAVTDQAGGSFAGQAQNAVDPMGAALFGAPDITHLLRQEL
jgi:hypothetical protein